MNKKEAFREFIKERPQLASYVENGQMTWQKFFELYDLYGAESSVWDKYTTDRAANLTDGLSKISNMVKKVDMNSIKNHINTAQKALDLVQDFATKKPDVASELASLNKGPAAPRPLNKFFED